MPLSDDCVVIFDLDDTLYAERDFVRSGFGAISRRFELADHERVFRELEERFDHGDPDPLGTVLKLMGSRIEKESLIHEYREHEPELELASCVQALLKQLVCSGHDLGILTDGRSTTQRNKIRALGLLRWVSEIVISEEFGSTKPDPRNYKCFEKAFPERSYAYVGDNLAKDFVTPNQLGWTTIALLDRGLNIHPQRLDAIAPGCGPQFFVHELA